jgi:hypothetical protein
VRIYSDGGAAVNAVQVDVFYDGNWTNIYSGALVKGSWQIYPIPSGNQTVTQARVRYWNSHASATRTAECHEFQFWASDLRPQSSQAAITRLRKVGSDLWLDVLVPYKWIQTAVYPIYIDPDTGVKYATSVSTQSVSPEDDVDWTGATVANLNSDNNVYATCSLDYPNKSYRLKCTNFAFAITGPAVIDGIYVEIRRKADVANQHRDYRVQLLDASGTLVGSNKKSTTYYTTSEVTATYGSSADTWTASPTEAMVEDADFGVCFSASCDGLDGATSSVEFIRMTIYYTVTPTITNSQAAWSIGSVGVNDVRYFSVNNLQDDDYSMVTNTGGCAVNVAIQGLAIEGGAYDWTLASSAGDQAYSLYANTGNGSSTYNIEVKTSSYSDLCSALPVSGTYLWSMKFTAPTAFNTNEDGEQKTTTVTLVASAA